LTEFASEYQALASAERSPPGYRMLFHDSLSLSGGTGAKTRREPSEGIGISSEYDLLMLPDPSGEFNTPHRILDRPLDRPDKGPSSQQAKKFENYRMNLVDIHSRICHTITIKS
jgi:hypothetical protein